MNPFILMDKTGKLVLGYRICFMDANYNTSIHNVQPQGVNYQVGFLSQHGWLIEHPISPLKWFVNMEFAEHFEVLGEL